eukprot:gene484-10160_t
MDEIQKHSKILQLAKITLKEISDNDEIGDEEDLQLHYEQDCELMRKVELSIYRTKDQMLEEEQTLDEITTWAALKSRISGKQKEKADRELQKEIEKQRILNEEAVGARLEEQREREEASIRQIQREEEWITRKLQLEKKARELTIYKGRDEFKPDFVNRERFREQDFELLLGNHQNIRRTGLIDPPSNDSVFHEDFTQHLLKKEEGYYETRLPWRPDHHALPENKVLATARLQSTTKRLEITGKLKDYHEDRNIIEYRFTRVIFGAGPSPYILGATLQKHVLDYIQSYPDTVNALLKETYMDDIQYGGDSLEELVRFKEQATEIMKEGGFTLHKWHSNIASLESTAAEKGRQKEEDDVREQMNQHEELRNTAKILGIQWDKDKDQLQINFDSCHQTDQPVTKRKMLAVINSIFDLLGWISPVTITAKILFSELCLRKVTWDESLPEDIQRRRNLWIKGLKLCPTITIPRSVKSPRDEKLSVHGFADASKQVVCAAVYLLVTYPTGTVDKNLLVAKSRILPREFINTSSGTGGSSHTCEADKSCYGNAELL